MILKKDTLLRKLFITMLVISMVFSTLHAQEFIGGYIVMSNGDTLKGQILNASPKQISKEVIIKSSTKERQKFEPRQVNSFVVGKENYIVADIEGETYFMRELVSGFLRLYTYTTTKPNYAIRKGESFVKLDEKTYVQDLEKYCSDCKRLNFSDVITFEAAYPFEKSGIAKFAYNYNMWMFQEHPIPTEKKTNSNKLKSKFGVFTGAESQSVMIKLASLLKSSEQRNGNGFYAPTIGISYQYGIAEGFSIQAEGIYSQIKFEYIDEDKWENVSWNNNYKATIVRVPIGGNYQFARGKKLSPFVGVAYQFIFRGKEESNLFIKANRLKFDSKNLWRGVLFSVGCDYKLNNVSLFAQGRYSVDSIIDGISDATSIGVVRSLHFNMGVKLNSPL